MIDKGPDVNPSARLNGNVEKVDLASIATEYFSKDCIPRVSELVFSL